MDSNIRSKLVFIGYYYDKLKERQGDDSILCETIRTLYNVFPIIFKDIEPVSLEYISRYIINFFDEKKLPYPTSRINECLDIIYNNPTTDMINRFTDGQLEDPYKIKGYIFN